MKINTDDRLVDRMKKTNSF